MQITNFRHNSILLIIGMLFCLQSSAEVILNFSSFPSNPCTNKPTHFTDLSYSNPPAFDWFWIINGPYKSDSVSKAANFTQAVFYMQNPSHLFDFSGYYWIGFHLDNGTVDSLTWFSKFIYVDSTCINNKIITGNVYSDLDANCIKDSSDFPLENFSLKLEPINIYTKTDKLGNYSFTADTGSYIIKQIFPSNSLWGQACPKAPDYYSVSIKASDSTISNFNFANKVTTFCTFLNINVSTWALRPCRESNYTVNYCNTGTAIAKDVLIKIELDDYLKYSSTDGGNLISQSGNVLIFKVDSVKQGQCGTFYFKALVDDCDMFMMGHTLGNTLCVKAHIYPDSSCTEKDSTWDKSSVTIRGKCVNDSVACFTIHNAGETGNGNMQGTSEYRIFENGVLVYKGTFQLNGQDSTEICRPTNNNSIRLEADQRPGHPGKSKPRDYVEACGDTSKPFTTGYITSVPLDDEDAFVSVFCMRVTSSYDPNDKQVIPTGLTDSMHYIDSLQSLTYNIRFQNTGNDTAFRIVIIDTLSQYMDPNSVEVIASSHSYNFQVVASTILKWTFENILLPDSNINEVASHGFVKYKVAQFIGNQKKSMITNKAGIYFDFNSPVNTNSVFNTIGNIDSLIKIPCSDISVLSTISNASCYQLNDGSITASIQGGTPNYSYLWNTGASQKSITNLLAGTYVFTVVDANDCVEINQYEVTSPAALLITAAIDSATQGNADGAIDINISGGTSPYSFYWDNQLTTEDIDSLLAGTYKVKVSDANNCTDSLIIKVPEITSIEYSQINSQGINIFPNPTNEAISIQMIGYNNIQSYLSLHDIAGKVVYLQSFKNKQTNETIAIDLRDLQKGVYNLKIISGSQIFNRIIAVN